MPTYSYKCDKCNTDFELFFFIKDYQESPKCSSCNSNKTHRNYMLDVSTQAASVKKGDNEITLGHLADRNRDRMTDAQKQRLQEKHYAYRKNRETNIPKGMKKIDTDTKIQWTDKPIKKRREKTKKKR